MPKIVKEQALLPMADMPQLMPMTHHQHEKMSICPKILLK